MGFNLSDFTRRAYGTNYIETLRVQIHANCRLRRIYFSDRLYSEEELPPEFKLFLPVQKGAPGSRVRRPERIRVARQRVPGSRMVAPGAHRAVFSQSFFASVLPDFVFLAGGRAGLAGGLVEAYLLLHRKQYMPVPQFPRKPRVLFAPFLFTPFPSLIPFPASSGSRAE